MSDSKLVKALLSLSEGGRGGRVRNNSASSQSPAKYCVSDVIKKLKRHPDYQDIDHGNQLKTEAEELTTAQSVMDRFFSSIIHDMVHERIKENEMDSTTDLTTTYERGKKTNRKIGIVESIARLQVKLLLRYTDNASQPSKLIGRLASAFQMEYGPLHASLLINNEILLEWNASSLVIPKFIDPRTGPVLVSATVQDHTRPQHQLSKPFEAYDEIELIFDAARKKGELLHDLARVIARYNSSYYYDVIFRNCQNFVLDALTAIGCKNKPEFSGNLREYFTHLKREGKVKADFETHAELDEFVKENHTKLSPANMEYILAQYCVFHTHSASATKSGTIACRETDCMVEFLEAKIDHGMLIMHRFLRPVELTQSYTSS